uniref:Uncharacterized protein n=1 Tax=Daphnia galeata TaxID=27404 RepID=A0A8J2S919_9CRUS|nr:unnamed protein product [Daphnia galeata]
MSFSSKSNNNDADKHYKKLYFDPQADSSKGAHYYISDGELREKLKELVDDSEKITEVRLYSHPLTNLQVTAELWRHDFILFETDKWWWSIEKNDAGVTIQRSKHIEYVRDRYRRAKRTTGLFGMHGIKLEKKYKGKHRAFSRIYPQHQQVDVDVPPFSADIWLPNMTARLVIRNNRNIHC